MTFSEPLCETLPEGIPSLALNLAVVSRGNYTTKIKDNVFATLGLKGMPIDDYDETLTFAANNRGSYPGADTFHVIAKLEKEKQGFERLEREDKHEFRKDRLPGLLDELVTSLHDILYPQHIAELENKYRTFFERT